MSSISQEESRRGLLSRIYSIFFWIALVIINIIMFSGALVVFLATFWFDHKRTILHYYSCFWAQLFFYLNPAWKLTIEGREHLPRNKAAIMVVNHESLGDILALFGLYIPFKWISKASVFKVPIIGWNMKMARYIPVIRGNRKSVEKMMDLCRYWLKEDVPLLMFPEGTRSKDGKVGPFKNGAFSLAIEANCPIVPMVITGTREGLQKHQSNVNSKLDCVIKVLPEIHPKDFESLEELRETARDLIIEAKKQIKEKKNQ